MNAGSPLDEIMALRAALTQAEARADAAEANAAQAVETTDTRKPDRLFVSDCHEIFGLEAFTMKPTDYLGKTSIADAEAFRADRGR
jgi:hypothetical protein